MTMTEPSLLPNRGVDATLIELLYEWLPIFNRVSGYPRVGKSVLGNLGNLAIGVWEITPGISRDIEVDEFFVVLQGEGFVRFADGSPDLILRPGTVGRLSEGTPTTWHVSQTLRKIYIA